MRPTLEQQVSPAPWLVTRSRVNVPALIRKALAIHPSAGADEIVGQLADWGVQASGIIVSMWMMRWKHETEQTTSIEVPGKAADHVEDTDLYCTCSEGTCSCGRPAPPWWQQYCCGVRITKQQIKERDNFFEHAAT